MPIIIEFEFEDGTKHVERIPAEIWRRKNTTANKLYWFDKKVVRVVLDPFLETADVDRGNNYWPQQTQPSRFDLYKARKVYKYQAVGENEMQKAKRAEDKK